MEKRASSNKIKFDILHSLNGGQGKGGVTMAEGRISLVVVEAM